MTESFHFPPEGARKTVACFSNLLRSPNEDFLRMCPELDFEHPGLFVACPRITNFALRNAGAHSRNFQMRLQQIVAFNLFSFRILFDNRRLG